MSFIKVVQPEYVQLMQFRALAERLLTALESHFDLDADETALICEAQSLLAASFNQGP